MQQRQSTDTRPLLSIIIPVYNADRWLEKAIQSVTAQRLAGSQLLVIDGGSTDRSLDIIQQYAYAIDTVVSEKDNGIYDAMNKGVDRAVGQWIYFLGADDQLEPDVLNKIAPYLKPEFAVVYGPIRFDNGQRLDSKFGWRTVFQNTVHHQGAFYHRSLFESFRYDTQLRIISDYELNLRIFLQRLPTCRLSFLVALCHAGGASSDMPLSLKETNQIRSRYIKFWQSRLLTKLLRLYYWQKHIRANH